MHAGNEFVVLLGMLVGWLWGRWDWAGRGWAGPIVAAMPEADVGLDFVALTA